METIAIRYNKTNKLARSLVATMKASGVVEVISIRKKGLERALEEARKGPLHTFNSAKEAMAFLNED